MEQITTAIGTFLAELLSAEEYECGGLIIRRAWLKGTVYIPGAEHIEKGLSGGPETLLVTRIVPGPGDLAKLRTTQRQAAGNRKVVPIAA